MAGGVEAVLAAVHDGGAQRREAVEHGLNARLVAGDDLGGVQDEVVAVQLQRVVLLPRRQRQRRPRLRLTAAAGKIISKQTAIATTSRRAHSDVQAALEFSLP